MSPRILLPSWADQLLTQKLLQNKWGGISSVRTLCFLHLFPFPLSQGIPILFHYYLIFTGWSQGKLCYSILYVIFLTNWKNKCKETMCVGLKLTRMLTFTLANWPQICLSILIGLHVYLQAVAMSSQDYMSVFLEVQLVISMAMCKCSDLNLDHHPMPSHWSYVAILMSALITIFFGTVTTIMVHSMSRKAFIHIGDPWYSISSR